jgi:hypothetical protein
MHSGRAVERGQLDPGVLADRPRVAGERAAEVGLPARVLVIGVAVLRRKLRRAEQLELPVRQRRSQLLQLVRVLRRELRDYLRQRTPTT